MPVSKVTYVISFFRVGGTRGGGTDMKVKAEGSVLWRPVGSSPSSPSVSVDKRRIVLRIVCVCVGVCVMTANMFRMSVRKSPLCVVRGCADDVRLLIFPLV